MKEVFTVESYAMAFAWAYMDLDTGEYDLIRDKDALDPDYLFDLNAVLYRGDDEAEAESIYDNAELKPVKEFDVDGGDDEYDRYCGGPYTYTDAIVCWKICIDDAGNETKTIKSVKYPELKRGKARW